MITDWLSQVGLPSYYEPNASTVPVFITFFAILMLGLYVLLTERHSSVRSAFFFMTLPATVWLLAFSFMYAAKTEVVAAFWARAAYVGVPFIPATVYYFTVKVLRLFDKKIGWVVMGFMAAALFSVLIVNTNFLIDGVRHYPWGYYPRYTFHSVYYLVYFFGFLAMCLWHFVAEYRNPQNAQHRARIKWLLYAFSVATLGGVDFFAKFGIPVYPFGYVCVLGFVAIAAYAVMRYRLVDVTTSFAADTIIGAMADALLVLDADDTVRVANEEALRLFRLSREQIVGRNLHALSPAFPSRDTPKAAEAVGIDKNYEIEHALPDGHKLFLSISESAMKDEMGCVVATVLILRDVTDWKRTEQELAAAKKRFEGLYRDVSEAIVVLDEYGRVHSVNPSAEKLLGLSSQKIVGRIFVMADFLPADFMGKVMQVVRNVIRGIPEPAFSLYLTPHERETVHLEAQATAVEENGKVAGVQFIFRYVPQNAVNS